MGSPHVASAVQMGPSAAVVTLFVVAGADPILVTVPAMTGFGTLGIIALQAAAAVAVVVFFRRRRDRRYLSTLVAPALGGVGLIAAFVMAVANFSTIAGSDSPVIARLPWLLLVTMVAGVVVARHLGARRPDDYAALGTDFVAGGEASRPAKAAVPTT